MNGMTMEYAYSAPSNDQDRHIWSLVGPDGAVHIWARQNPSLWIQQWGERFSGGVERHSPVPVYDWDETDKPHHEDCFLLKGPCWHDGSSLYFSDNIAPMLSGGSPFSDALHEYMKSELQDWYSSIFPMAAKEKPHD